METLTLDDQDLTEKVKAFRRLTGLGYEKIAAQAGVSSKWVWSVANPKEGQVFDEDKAATLRAYLDQRLREHIADASALLGEDDPTIEKLVTRLGAKRRT